MKDLKRLHKVHYDYPHNSRRQGKTYYCFDQLLRVAQTGEIKEQVYITNTQSATVNGFKSFLRFLDDAEESFTYSLENLTVSLGECKIKFVSLAGKERLKGSRSTVVEDYF